MPETVYAAFADPAQAESAAGALLDQGVAAKDISIVLNEDAKKRVEGHAEPPEASGQPTILTDHGSGLGAFGGFDPLGNNLRQGSGIPPIPGGEMLLAEEADQTNDLNPALDDYPRTGSASPTELSSRPPNSKYDWNADLDKKTYNEDYEGTNSEKVDDEIRLEGDRDRDRVDPASVAKENDEGTIADSRAPSAASFPAPPNPHASEQASKAGVATTTVQNAASGAAKGVAAGLGLGALAAVAAIAIPGVGLILGGGALAAAVAGLAATSGAGAVAGGIVAYLKEQGVPADQIHDYQTAYEGGGAVVSVVVEGGDRSSVQETLRKHGATSVRPFGYAA